MQGTAVPAPVRRKTTIAAYEAETQLRHQTCALYVAEMELLILLALIRRCATTATLILEMDAALYVLLKTHSGAQGLITQKRIQIAV